MMGDFNTWESLAQNHYLVNSGLMHTMNPFLALVYVLNMRKNPLLVKQVLLDYEFASLSSQLAIDI